MQLLLLIAFITINWFLTMLGSSLVFFSKKQNEKLVSIALGSSAGIMIAASFFSLLLPAISMSEDKNIIFLCAIPIGFVCGVFFLRILDYILPHEHIISHIQEGLPSRFSKNRLLFFAMTLHNIPEGLAVGIAFASSSYLLEAIILSIGIGIQNFPEGTAISLPMYSSGKSKFESFMYGQGSALVEIPAGIIGYLFAKVISSLLPFALSFAAGAMIFVCIEEIIPEAMNKQYRDESALSTMFGFLIMMCLDIFLS